MGNLWDFGQLHNYKSPSSIFKFAKHNHNSKNEEVFVTVGCNYKCI